MKFQCLVVALCFGVCVMAGKYSREMNEKPSDGDGRTVEFRVAKLNQVWEKAKRVRVKCTQQTKICTVSKQLSVAARPRWHN